MKQYLCILGLLCLLSACGETSDSESHDAYLRHVGDAEFDPALDNPDFQTCHGKLSMQYYNFGKSIRYQGEKISLEREVHEGYQMAELPGEDGYITIRFLVNCEGKTGRFRLSEMDEAYKEKHFDPAISQRLLAVVKSLEGWEIGYYKERARDYYQHLIFKLKDGQIKDIMP